MEKQIIWTGVDCLSIEKCNINKKEDSFHIKGELVGNKNNQVFGVEYQIVVDLQWQTRFFSINSSVANKYNSISGHKLNHLWIIDEIEYPEFNTCLDIDISVTPFTNTLPINRLKLGNLESESIDVLYINPIEDKRLLVKQQYTKQAENSYYYKNLWSDFDATIEVDTEGIVTNYPKLFKQL
ncbi:MAG: putative glycolipid-binding domain-containing protein [Flavobacteriaceae bacterium]|jgi:hypothetical protein|nr:putative glycolipid-binding domain-containing protein [Flavobacteriaceae bacterium]